MLWTALFLPLHSIMFLLILKDICREFKVNYFTFHNVSINTRSVFSFLSRSSSFTFHNVSINTNLQCRDGRGYWLALHSIIFLLIRNPRKAVPSLSFNFTFHNVSINTTIQKKSSIAFYNFTFHNVSINTVEALALCLLSDFLYIP